MKIKPIVAAAVLSFVAFDQVASAGIPVTPGNVLTPECDLPSRFDNFNSVGTFQSPPTLSAVKSSFSPGKDLNVGDAVFYVQLQQSRTYYSIPKQAELIDRSPITPDVAVEAGKKYEVWAYYTYRKTGEKFIFLKIPAPGIPLITQDGKLCSAEINNMRLVGMPQAYQAPDAVFQKSQEPTGNGNTVAVAVILKDADAASVTFEVTFSRNGRIESRKTVGFDRMSGEGKIGALDIQFGDGSDGAKTIRIKSISEPDNWSAWLGDVFAQVL